MEKLEKYKEHIKDCWDASLEASREIFDYASDTELKNIRLAIFDKLLTPFHYFTPKEDIKENNDEPPTEKQISYANKLGIPNPEQYTKMELAREIDKKVS